MGRLEMGSVADFSLYRGNVRRALFATSIERGVDALQSPRDSPRHGGNFRVVCRRNFVVPVAALGSFATRLAANGPIVLDQQPTVLWRPLGT